MKKLKGRLDISGRMSGGDDAHRMVSIQLVDDSSRCHLVDILMTKEDFAEAMFGRSGLPCEFEFYDDCPVGKTREVKTQPVWLPEHNYKDRDKAARLALKKHEADGWEGRDSDLGNMHCRNRMLEPLDERGAWYDVVFIRFVDSEGAS